MIDLDDVFPLRSPQLSAALERAPRHRLSVSGHLDYGNALPIEDQRYVQTTTARAEDFAWRFYSQLGFDPGEQLLPPTGSRGRMS